MKILVTGGAGYLGSVLSRLLLEKGHGVRVLDRLLHGGGGIEALHERAGFEFLEGDLRDDDLRTRALEEVGAVVHLAAIVGDPACARRPAEALAVNRDASLEVLEACREAGIPRLVFASTCSNYGKMADAEGTVDESSPLRPVSLYAETKVEVERALLEHGAQGTPPLPTILRFATLYGLSPRMRFDLTVNEFTMELETRGELVVYGEEFWRPYLHVADAARAVARVLEAEEDQVAGRVFNVGDTEENYRKREIVELVREAVGSPTRIERVAKDEDPRDYRVSFARIRRELRFEIEHRVPDGIAEILQALRDDAFPDPRAPQFRN